MISSVRIPRMHARPPMMFGSKVMRSKPSMVPSPFSFKPEVLNGIPTLPYHIHDRFSKFFGFFAL